MFDGECNEDKLLPALRPTGSGAMLTTLNSTKVKFYVILTGIWSEPNTASFSSILYGKSIAGDRIQRRKDTSTFARAKATLCKSVLRRVLPVRKTLHAFAAQALPHDVVALAFYSCHFSQNCRRLLRKSHSSASMNARSHVALGNSMRLSPDVNRILFVK